MAAEDNGPTIVGVTWFLCFFCGGFLALRVYAKLSRRHDLWWDDYVLIAAWVEFTTPCSKLSLTRTGSSSRRIHCHSSGSESGVWKAHLRHTHPKPRNNRSLYLYWSIDILFCRNLLQNIVRYYPAPTHRWAMEMVCLVYHCYAIPHHATQRHVNLVAMHTKRESLEFHIGRNMLGPFYRRKLWDF